MRDKVVQEIGKKKTCENQFFLIRGFLKKNYLLG
jgi:hypothetical protein